MIQLNRSQREYTSNLLAAITTIIVASIIIEQFASDVTFSVVKFLISFSIALFLYIFGVILRRTI